MGRFSRRAALLLAVWTFTLWTFAAGLADSVKGTAATEYFPALALGCSLGWFFSGRQVKTFIAWILILAMGIIFIGGFNGRLAQPSADFLQEGILYQARQVESRFTHAEVDPENLRQAQTNLSQQIGDVSRRVAQWTRDLRAGRTNNDTLARQIGWSALAFALTSLAGWMLRKRERAFLALLPCTLLLGYLEYFSGPEPTNLQLYLLSLLMLTALTEGSAPLRRFMPDRVPSGEALTATFLLAFGVIFLAGLIPPVSVQAVAEAIQARSSAAQNYAAARALGLEHVVGESAPGEFSQPGLPSQHLLGGSPSLSQTVLFTVSTGDLPPMPRVPPEDHPPFYYWRTITYDTYTGHGWAVSLNESRDEKANALLVDTIPYGYRLVQLEMRFTSPSPLAWTGELLRADQPLRTAWRSLPGSRAYSLDPLRGADLIGATSSAASYQVQSILPEFTLQQLRASPSNYPDWVRDEYLALPAELPTRLRDLASEWTSGQPTAYDRAAAIESHLRKIPYTLDVPLPPSDHDVADYFLFDLKKGYCDYYATAMVVLARAVGLPARLVTGYASGQYLAPEAHYLVRASDAHSWVEVYFTGLGWVQFEPTPIRPLILRAEGTPIEVEVSGRASLGNVRPQNPFVIFLEKISALPVALWVSILLVPTLLFAVLFAIREGRRRNTPIETISSIYQQVYRAGRKLLGPSLGSRTPLAFAGMLTAELQSQPRARLAQRLLSPAGTELATLTDLYIRALYSPVTPTREEVIQAIAIWRKLFWRLQLARMIH